jgi:ribosome-associated translation inhibitor RaiA
MQTPLQLEVEGFEPSAHLRDVIDEHVAKLERLFGRITAARVAIRAPNANHKGGEPYLVSIWLSLPNNGEVSVRPRETPNPRLTEVVFAVTDAFRRADRQLHDYASKLKKRPRPDGEGFA